MAPKDVKPARVRPIDEEKSERQRKGLDGDALAEMDERAARRPHDEVFNASGARRSDEPEEG